MLMCSLLHIEIDTSNKKGDYPTFCGPQFNGQIIPPNGFVFPLSIVEGVTQVPPYAKNKILHVGLGLVYL